MQQTYAGLRIWDCREHEYASRLRYLYLAPPDTKMLISVIILALISLLVATEPDA